MPGTVRPESPSDSFWPDSPNAAKASSTNVPFINTRSKELYLKDFLHSVDDSPDFHDPYSDLNLFLSQKIMQEMRESGFAAKKWCLKIQEELIEKITPEFQKKFPQYRLGISALRKTWEKIAYYSQQIRHQKEAITQDGKLNIHFFIKENLKQYAQLKSPYNLHPYHYAHQLAVKMSECIATVDGARPKLEHLTKMIWAMQRHLLTDVSPQNCKSPYDEYDKIDKLIVKTILEITAKEPHLSQNELKHEVKESLESLKDLPSFASLDMMTCNISALLAEKVYPTSSFHTSFLSEQKRAICNFIRRQVALYKGSVPTPQLSELVRRILALYMLASGLPKNLKEEEIQAAIRATYPLVKEDRPPVNQSIYAFISAESVLMKNDQYCHSVDYVTETITLAYQEAKCLPELKGPAVDLLEIVIWKTLSETEGLLEKLPYVIGQRIEDEIANILMDNPHQSFASVVSATVDYFKRIKELALSKKWGEIERKIHLWSLQGDMLCRWIRLDSDSPLLKLISQKCLSSTHCGKTINYQEFISEVCIEYLKKHPELAIYTPKLMLRILILYKYTWYTLLSKSHESSFDRFIEWHITYLSSHSPLLEADQTLKLLEELCKKMVPLIPFDADHARLLIGASKEQDQSQDDQRNA